MPRVWFTTTSHDAWRRAHLRGDRRVWPDAPIYTTLYSRDGTDGRFTGRECTPPIFRARRAAARLPAAAAPLPARGGAAPCVRARCRAVEQQRVRPWREAEGRRRPHLLLPQPVPLRMARGELTLREAPAFARPVVRRMLDRIRRWDLEAAARVTHYIANSEVTRERIHAAYGRDASVIHPPVEIEWLEPGTPEDFFLVVTELAPHKRVHVALEAARLAGKQIKVVGAGPELARLRSSVRRQRRVPGARLSRRAGTPVPACACSRGAQRRRVRHRCCRGTGCRQAGGGPGCWRYPRNGRKRRDRRTVGGLERTHVCRGPPTGRLRGLLADNDTRTRRAVLYTAVRPAFHRRGRGPGRPPPESVHQTPR